MSHVQRYFGAIPRPERKLNTTYTEQPPQDGERLVKLHRVGDVGINGFGTTGVLMFRISARRDSPPAALELLRQILREPRFDDGEFESLKRAELANVEKVRSDDCRL